MTKEGWNKVKCSWRQYFNFVGKKRGGAWKRIYCPLSAGRTRTSFGKMFCTGLYLSHTFEKYKKPNIWLKCCSSIAKQSAHCMWNPCTIFKIGFFSHQNSANSCEAEIWASNRNYYESPLGVLVLLPPGLCNSRHHQKWGKCPYLYVRSKVYENISNFGSGCASPAFLFLLSVVVHKLLNEWRRWQGGARARLPV